MKEKKSKKQIVYKKNPTSKSSSTSSASSSSAAAASSSSSSSTKNIIDGKHVVEATSLAIPKTSSNKINFHEKVSFRGRKNPVAVAVAVPVVVVPEPKASSSSSSSRVNFDVRWEGNCEALAGYCKEHQKLPTAAKGLYVTPDDQKMNLGTWMDKQKVRYKSMNPKNALSEMELTKLMAIKEFREWAEDPLTDPDVRWDTHCQALAEYCKEHEKLPTAKFITDDDRKLNLGIWMNRQKVRLKGQVERPPLDDAQLNKLRAIKEFRVWLDDPLSNTAFRWDAHYQAFVAYCQEHNEMPPWKYVTPNEPKLNLEAWVDNQKKRYKLKGTGAPLNDNERSKLLEVKEFREWTEKVQKQQTTSGKKENSNVKSSAAGGAAGNVANTANIPNSSSSSSSSSASSALSGLALLSASGGDGGGDASCLSGLAFLSAGAAAGGSSSSGDGVGKKKEKKQKLSLV